MKYFLIKFKVFKIIILFSFFPLISFAQIDNQVCSQKGYTVITINGVFTDKDGAIKNRDKLKDLLDDTFNSQTITVDYLHNPSHLGGIGDVAKVVYQKIFDNETVEDYDLIEMLKSASEKVKTQKLLLVAHSQGNFYANSFYDTVAGKNGGVPAESIGIYSVATPASRVAGEGRWLTSDTDKVIADLVASMPFKKIMEPNTSIVLAEGDDSLGHNFSGVYLKYRGSDIVSGIQSSLSRLTENNVQNKENPCMAPPKLTLAHKATGAVFAVVDPAANASKDAIIVASVNVYQAGKALAKGVYSLTSLIAGAGASLLEEDEKPPIKTYSLWVGAEEHSQPATLTVDKPASSAGKSADKFKQAEESLQVLQNQILALENQPPSRTPLDGGTEKKSNVPTIRNEPRILFIGMVYPGFGGGGDGVQTQIEKIIIQNTDEQKASSLSAPIISVPQCDYSIAVDGCLLATTTVVFSWQAVSSSDYYALNKNGEYSTTTDLFFSAAIPDFSDYNFSVSAVSSATTSATTTVQTVSVATIPIAINEIAWMGTTASSYDEWMELKNNTGYRINLSQWAIESADSVPYIVLSGEMSPYEYRVLERRENTITARAVISSYGNGSYQWALGNNGEELFLSHSSTTLDKSPAIDGDSWLAGENTSSTTRKTMERIDSKQSGATSTNWATWGTNVDFIKNGNDTDDSQILGTPGECNSASFININGGQNIASSTTLEANNCYYVSAGARVSASSTLAIEEGARVSLFQSNLYIDGVLDVNGAENNPVIFDSFSGEATANRIRISGNSGTSTIDNAVISDTGGIYLNSGGDVEITNTDFVNNNYGIELNNGSMAVIENVNFSSTTKEAISAYNESVVEVASSTISDTLTADAIGIYDSSLSMSSTTINAVYNGDGIGAYDSTVSIASSTISNILDGDGLGLYNSTTTISNVTIENIDGDGIAVYGGTISGNATVDGAEVEF